MMLLTPRYSSRLRTRVTCNDLLLRMGGLMSTCKDDWSKFVQLPLTTQGDN